MKVYTRWMWNQLLLHAAFWRTIFLTAAFPHTHKFLIERISSSLISTETLVIAVTTIAINSLYAKYSDWIFSKFKVYCVLECSIYAVILPMVGTGMISPSSYFLTDIIVGSIVCRFLHCSANRLRKLYYDREEREKFDNSQPIVSAVSSIVGGCLGMLPIPLWAAWCCVAVGIVIDDIFYWVAYNRVTK